MVTAGMIASLYNDSDAIKILYAIAFGKRVEAAVAHRRVPDRAPETEQSQVGGAMPESG
jgi:hypothetical protein